MRTTQLEARRSQVGGGGVEQEEAQAGSRQQGSGRKGSRSGGASTNSAVGTTRDTCQQPPPDTGFPRVAHHHLLFKLSDVKTQATGRPSISAQKNK